MKKMGLSIRDTCDAACVAYAAYEAARDAGAAYDTARDNTGETNEQN